MARTASTENGSTVSPIRIAPLAPTASIGPQDGAEIAGIAHILQRHPEIVGGRLDAANDVKRCSNTPITVCGLSRRVILASTASLTARHLAAARMRRRRKAPHQRLIGDLRRMNQHADRPSRLDRVGDELQPLGDEQPACLAVLRQRQAADFLDQRIGEAGDRASPGRVLAGRLLAIGRPPAEQRRRQSPPAAFFAQHQFARFEPAAEPVEALGGKFVDRQKRGPDRIGGEDQESRLVGEQLPARPHHLRQIGKRSQTSPFGPRPNFGGSRMIPS